MLSTRLATTISAALVATSVLASQAAVEVPVTVSPGSRTEYATVRGACPTFSWGLFFGAESFELEVFQLDHSEGEPTGTLVWTVRLPGSVSSWTPDSSHCLDAGQGYAWFVRAERADTTTDWSEGRMFEIPSEPTIDEIARATEILERALGLEGAGARNLGEASVSASANDNRPGAANRSKRERRQRQKVENAATTATAIRIGHQGLDRSSASAETIVIENSGGGGLTLDVLGAVLADSFVGDGSELTAVSAADVNCVGCVTGTAVASSSITGTDILNSSITGADIASESVTSSDIAANTILSSDIRDGEVTVDDLANGAVRAPKLPGIRVVSVECNGECGDSTLAQICGTGYRPIAVDCDSIESDTGQGEVGCGGDNVCRRQTFVDGRTVASFCLDQAGWDAHLFCLPF